VGGLAYKILYIKYYKFLFINIFLTAINSFFLVKRAGISALCGASLIALCIKIIAILINLFLVGHNEPVV